MLAAFVVVLVLLALAVGALVAASALGIDSPRVAQTRHALGEARHRATGVLAEFRDWLRMGR